MLFRNLTLTNYGLFAGRHTFDLAPRMRRGRQRPVILFGGKNGAGKTTILEAIRVALYGRLALGPRVRQVDYDAFLRNHVHRGQPHGVSPTEAAVAIEFDHVHRGDLDAYRVERSWQLAGRGEVAEVLLVTKNGHALDELDSEFWQGFVRDVIPEGLAQLFFFDGEKIRELAEDTTGSGSLADSIKSLLGLDLVERLDADLTVYANRQVAKVGSSNDRAEAARLEATLGQLQTETAIAQEQLASLRTKDDGIRAEIRHAEEHLRREGEDLARRRERLHAEQATLAAKVQTAEAAIRDQCDHLFPLSLCPKTARLLTQELKAERTMVQAEHIREALVDVRSRILKSLTSKKKPIPALKAPAFAAAKALIASAFDSSMPKEQGEPLHGLSEGETRKTLSSLTAARGESLETVSKHVKDLSRWTTRLESIQRALAQIPADEVVAPRVQAITELNRSLGATSQAQTAAEEQLKRHEIDATRAQRELRRLTEHYEQEGEAASRIALARSVQSALADYLKALTQRKVSQLSEAVATCFNRLSRKGDVVQGVEIDPQTFTVRLLNRSGTNIPKEELSSGEKQIFAIAMLWALAQTSGRPLPVIIDTPLGRLDSDHRRKLILDYLPVSSHQVIVLSTDTEVDEELFELLRPDISHAYHLSYLPEERCTEVAVGYFWRTPEEAACST